MTSWMHSTLDDISHSTSRLLSTRRVADSSVRLSSVPGKHTQTVTRDNSFRGINQAIESAGENQLFGTIAQTQTAVGCAYLSRIQWQNSAIPAEAGSFQMSLKSTYTFC